MGASPQELYVTEYKVNLLLRSIELGGSAGTIAGPSRTTESRFWSVRLGESKKPAEKSFARTISKRKGDSL
ncbi:hypothetical protein [Bacillus wiedmannii]|uniref:hypothetical protein n=1 Tax=Bacillus wiedmannii TaxID=1890302 RepID=UPI001CC1D790|nr:hypothetical protein [Bacillus wiedmannii]